MQTTWAALVTVTPEQKEKLVEFFGKKGAAVVISHMDNLEGTFGSASAIIRKIMQGNQASA